MIAADRHDYKALLTVQLSTARVNMTAVHVLHAGGDRGVRLRQDSADVGN